MSALLLALSGGGGLGVTGILWQIKICDQESNKMFKISWDIIITVLKGPSIIRYVGLNVFECNMISPGVFRGFDSALKYTTFYIDDKDLFQRFHTPWFLLLKSWSKPCDKCFWFASQNLFNTAVSSDGVIRYVFNTINMLSVTEFFNTHKYY